MSCLGVVLEGSSLTYWEKIMEGILRGMSLQRVERVKPRRAQGRMPWLSTAKKDAASCEKLRGLASTG